MSDVENVIIVGSGPAGYTAALYTARANLNPLVIEGFAWGGLLQQTTDVENYPGFPEGIMGPEMMQRFRDQAERFGARLLTEQVDRVELSSEVGGIHSVWAADKEYRARTVVLSMGAEHKKLGVSGEEELSGRGVSYCATCDAAFFRDVPTIIVGGGDSAMEEAIFLSKFASKVIVVHRRDEFRASKIMLERAREQSNIEFLTPYVVQELVAGENGALGHARLENTETGEVKRARRYPAPSSLSGMSLSQGSSTARSTSTRTAMSAPRGARPAPTAPACSRRETSSTTPTARRSPPQHPDARRPWTPSGTCATRPACRRPRACRWATRPKRSGRRPPTQLAERALELEQPPLALQSSAVAADRAARAKHAVARDHDRDRVRTERVARGARAAGAASLRGDLAVAQVAAIGDLAGDVQDAPPERPDQRPVQVDRELAPAP